MSTRPLRALASLLLLCVLTVSACGSGERETITILGPWVGKEQATFEKVLADFEKQTGFNVDYTGTRDARAVLASNLHDGHPPNAAVLSTLGDLRAYAASGRLSPVAAGLPAGRGGDLTTVPGPDGARPYGIVVKASVKSLIWFPRTLAPGVRDRLGKARSWDELAAAASGLGRPWCLGFADKSASGWPGTDWIEDILLHRAGGEVYDAWVSGTLPWTSPQVRAAWQTFGSVVAAGSGDSLVTGYAAASARMFEPRPGCALAHGGAFITTLGSGPGARDADFVPFPKGGDIEIGGDVLGVFDRVEATDALVAYLTKEPVQRKWIQEQGSGAFSLSRAVPPAAYPDPLSRRIAQTLADATSVHFDASDTFPPVLAEAFDHAVLEYVAAPSRLEEILAALDRVQKASPPGS
ncbi:ABC transporter substrate-binding protein [Actinomadura roseirufa]|uniref:ABC transporter substrate-binding protein n=1 Tax=Actinomadura roseirufa TaxID=2094049 RepID=UPI001040F8C8|nr:extracellular solute-binding protein [Actinomadura roseirufa]